HGAPRDVLSLPTRRSSDLASSITVSTSAFLIYSPFIHSSFLTSKIAADVDRRFGSNISIKSSLLKISSSPSGDHPKRDKVEHRLDRKSTRLNSSHVSISYA